MSEKTDVFQEIHSAEALAQNFADLKIKVQFKIHEKGYYLLEGRDSIPDNTKCSFLFNIDGQAVTWEAPGIKENTPQYDDHGMQIPDGGAGIRFALEKRIRLNPGQHKIFFAIPRYGYYERFEIRLLANSENILDLRPIYNRNRWIDQDYTKGLSHFDVFLNDRQITEQ